MLEPKIINTIDAKFSIIEDKLRNSFKAIKKDKEEIEERISAISKKIDKINGKEELGELRAYFQKEINFLKEEVSKNSEITSKMDSKFNKANIKNEVERELGPGFDKRIDEKFKREVEKSKKLEERLKDKIYDLEKEFNLEIKKKEEKINKTLKEIEDSLEVIGKDFEKKIENSEEKNLEEIESLRRQISYLKGRLKTKEVEKVVIKEVEKPVEKVVIKEVEKKAKKPVKKTKKSPTKTTAKVKETKKLPQEGEEKKGFLTKIIDSLSD